MGQAVSANSDSVSDGKIYHPHSPQQNRPSGIQTLPATLWHKGLVNLHLNAFSKGREGSRIMFLLCNCPLAFHC